MRKLNHSTNDRSLDMDNTYIISVRHTGSTTKKWRIRKCANLNSTEVMKFQSVRKFIQNAISTKTGSTDKMDVEIAEIYGSNKTVSAGGNIEFGKVE